KAYHPNLFQRYSEAVFDSLYFAIKEKCKQDSLDSVEFNLQMAQFNALNDLHTDMRNPWGDIGRDMPYRFPAISFRGKEGFLNNNKILKIGNVEWNDLIIELDRTLSWEYNPIKKNAVRNEFFSSVMKYKYDINTPYECILLTETGDTIVEIIQPVEYFKMKRKAENTGYWGQRVHQGILQDYFFDEDSIAVLYYNTSSLSNKQQEVFQNQLEWFFNSVKTKQIKHLFIDVSYNGGGNDANHDYIYRYLKFDALKYSILSTYTYEGMAEFTQNFNGDASCEIFKEKYADYREGNKTIQETYALEKKGSKKGFPGKVYVIMGRFTFSAGFDFCELFKMANMGVLVGESAGQRSPYSGNVISYRMPNSQINFRCATLFTDYKEKELNVVAPDGFLYPDIPYPLIAPLELSDFKKIIELSKNR
ncbi:MAG: hypothetical protein LIO93_09915, partial [Bacteroidales bacterium]|nr:hypothetical protein [Bacteroidales bacterium]